MIEYPSTVRIISPEQVRTHSHQCGQEAPQKSLGGFRYRCRRRKGHTGRHAHIWITLCPGLVRAVWK